MAKLTKTSKTSNPGITGLGTGILQPQLPYRWRLRVPNGFTEEEHNRIACQAESIKLDYKNRTLVITLVQNATDTILHEAIIKLINKYRVILHIDSLNGVDATPDYILEFSCKPISHEFAFDYTDTRGGAAKHTIVLEYDTMTPYNQKEENLEIVEEEKVE